jgi:hypothetical protein
VEWCVKFCETCAIRPRWWPYAQCLTCLRYHIRPESNLGTGEVSQIRFRSTVVSEDNALAAHDLRRQRECWEQAHPGWIPRYLGAFRISREPAKSEPLGRYWHEVRYTLCRQRSPRHAPWEFSPRLPIEWIMGGDSVFPVLQESLHED